MLPYQNGFLRTIIKMKTKISSEGFGEVFVVLWHCIVLSALICDKKTLRINE